MNWITVHAFTYPHEAHMAKVKLESEGIEVRLLDELTAQVNNFYSNAIGGVKLQVKEGQEDTAKEILEDMEVIEEMPQEASPFLIYLDAFTRRFPFVGDSILELRIIVLVVLILLLLFLPMAIFQ